MLYNKISKEYKINQIKTADTLKLLIMLYEAAIKNLVEALNFIDDFKKYDKLNQNIFKTIEIIKELRISLDMSQGEVADNLDNLYQYMTKILLEANTKKDPVPLKESIKILEDLLAAWKEINHQGVVKPKRLSSENGFSITG